MIMFKMLLMYVLTTINFDRLGGIQMPRSVKVTSHTSMNTADGLFFLFRTQPFIIHHAKH